MALSRVRSLSGVYLTAFSPTSIMASRQKYRLELHTYDLPAKKSGKRKMTGTVDHVPPKKLEVEETISKSVKRKLTDQQTDTPAKHPKNGPPQSKHAGQSKRNSKRPEQLIKSSNRDPSWNFTYNPVGEAAQRHDCQWLNLTYRHGNRVTPGSPDTPLTAPDMHRLHDTKADGNCLFRAFSLLLTGTEHAHRKVRLAIVQHLLDNEQLLIHNAALDCLGLHCGISNAELWLGRDYGDLCYGSRAQPTCVQFQ